MKKQNIASAAEVQKSNKKTVLSGILQSRKLRSGAFSVAVTAIVIAFIICVNVFIKAADNRYGLETDFSFNTLTAQSETTKSVLNELDSDVHIYVLSSSSADTLIPSEDVLAVVKQYAARSEHVTYSEENIVKNPTFSMRFHDMLDENNISADCLIVASAINNRARVLNEDNYYGISYNMEGYYEVSGYTIEKSITEAILYVSRAELPVVQILTGHGELTEEETSETEAILSQNNYQVKRVSLAEADAASPLLIFSPQVDFTAEEMDMLDMFSDNGGNFMVISTYSDSLDMPNFNNFLLSYGIVPLGGICVADVEDTESYYESPAILMPYMQETEDTENLVRTGKNILLLTGSRAFDTTAELSNDLAISSILKSGKAYLRDYQDGQESLDQTESDPEGVFDLALLSCRTKKNGNRSKLFIMGNVGVFTDEWIMSNTHAPEFLIQMLSTLGSKKTISLDIVQKPAMREAMSYGSLSVPTIIALILPLLVLAAALIVLLKRKNL